MTLRYIGQYRLTPFLRLPVSHAHGYRILTDSVSVLGVVALV